MSYRLKATLIVCCLLTLNVLEGQKSVFYYKSIDFPENSVQWIHVLKDTIIKPNNPPGDIQQTKYSNFEGPHKTLFHNNNLILLYESTWHWVNGLFAEKINLSTGERIDLFLWDKRINGGIRELPENASIKADGSLEIITSRYPEGKFLPRLGVLTLDTSDMTMLNHTYGSFSDTNSLYLFSTRTFRNALALTVPKNETSYTNYQLHYIPTREDSNIYDVGLRSVCINNKGKILKDTNVFYIKQDLSSK